jgi:hypothetical protein
MLNDMRLPLPQVTLCAVTSVNVTATIRALEACLTQIKFANCLLMTDTHVQPENSEIRVVSIDRLASSAEYSDFMLRRLINHVTTSHCLTIQWDGHVINAQHWVPEFLEYDYIGASWPQFSDGHDVGNGGFSLRSRNLLQACQKAEFRPGHPEDISIGRTNRLWLESHGILFAPRDVANLFAAERASDPRATFGYHGVWNMPRAIGTEAFWNIYRDLEERSTLNRDFSKLLRDISMGKHGGARAGRMIIDRFREAVRARR